MEENEKLLIKYLSWFITLFIVIFFGISHPKAETKTIYSSNNSGTLSGSNQYLYGYLTGGGTIGVSTGTVGSSISGKSYGFIFWFYESVVLNKTYELTINFKSDDLVPNFSSNWVDIQSCSSSSCNSNTIVSVQKQSISGYSTWLKVKFNPVSTASYIKVDLGSDNNDALTGGAYGGTTYFGISSVSLTSTNESQDIINNQTNNTNNIINNNNSNTQEIISNQNQNTQDIIDNQNSNTQQQIESQEVCQYYDKNNVGLDNKYISGAYGVVSDSGNHIITPYISIDINTKIKVVDDFNSDILYYCFYNINQTVISCNKVSTLSSGSTLTIPNNASYFRSTISKTSNRPTYQVCKNGNQAIADQNEESEKTRKGILGKLGELFSTLFSDDDADISGLDNMVGWLPAGPLDSIINLPLNLFNSLTNVLSGTCSSVSLTLPFVNQQLILPCFDSFMSQFLTGFSTIWTFVGVTVSVFILYNYLLTLYKWVDDTLTLRENNLPGYYDDNWGGGA